MNRHVHLPAWYWTLATNEEPLLRVLAAHIWSWINSGSRARRSIIWFVILWQLAVIIQLLVAPGAIAATSVSGVEWTGITDTDGVPLANYMFVTDHGSLLNPGNKPLQMILSTEAGCFMVIVTLGLWVIGWALDFGWLRVIAPAFEKVSDALSFFQSKEVLIFTMTIGSAIVCWHWLVHQHSKAMGKLIIIVMVIVGGTVALSHGVTYLASEDGPLAMGRDVGLEVAKAIDPNLSGTSSNGTTQVRNLQAILADTVARAPLQMWNTGYNLDKEGGSCKQAWSQYTKAGNEDDLKDAIKGCGAANADDIAERLDHPTGGQVGTGALCIILGGIILWFLALAAFRVIVAGVQALFYCVIAPPAFALAFMLGGSVAFAARCAADAIVSALAMGGYVIFLAGSMVAINAILNNPSEWGNGFGALVILCIVLVAMVHLLKRLNSHLEMDSRKISKLFSTGPAFAGGQHQSGTNSYAPPVQQGITFSPVSPFMDISQRLAGAAGDRARRSVGMLRNWQTGGDSTHSDGTDPTTGTEDLDLDETRTTPENPPPARHIDPDQIVPAETGQATAAGDAAAHQAGTATAEAATKSAAVERAQTAAAVVAPEADVADIALQTAAAAIHHHQSHPGNAAYPVDGQQPVPAQLPATQASAGDVDLPAPPAPAAPPSSGASPWSSPATATVPVPADDAASAAVRAAIRNPWARPVDPSIYDDEPDPATPAPPASTAPRR